MQEFHYSSGGGHEAAIGGCFILACLLIGLVISVLAVLVFCKIFSKAGYHWAMGLLSLIPGFGQIIVLLILAFGQRPIENELQALRRAQMTPPPGQPHESFRGN
ncbi:MAG: hypothetical protein ABFR90_00815 [Planctomycetota bacterium]